MGFLQNGSAFLQIETILEITSHLSTDKQCVLTFSVHSPSLDVYCKNDLFVVLIKNIYYYSLTSYFDWKFSIKTRFMNSHKMCEKLKVSITYAVSLTDQCCSPKVEQNNSIEIFVIVTSLALRALANRSAKFRSHRRILVTSFLTLLREIILL